LTICPRKQHAFVDQQKLWIGAARLSTSFSVAALARRGRYGRGKRSSERVSAVHFDPANERTLFCKLFNEDSAASSSRAASRADCARDDLTIDAELGTLIFASECSSAFADWNLGRAGHSK
jgi:hypothetical protein